MNLSADPLRYTVWNPTGNITALVESDVCAADRLISAAKIMDRHKDVEQVGFVHFPDPSDGSEPVRLHMAGGEFCGNASMCAAALYVMMHTEIVNGNPIPLELQVSGQSLPVHVEVIPVSPERFHTSIQIPPAKSIDDVELVYDGIRENIPVVRLEGISHAIITPQSGFFSLRTRCADAEKAVRHWCDEFSCSCLGLMFLAGESSDEYQLTPLVYVPGCETMFWEKSCSSGSAAAGMYLSKIRGSFVSLKFCEPGGVLRVYSDCVNEKYILRGTVNYSGSYSI